MSLVSRDERILPAFGQAGNPRFPRIDFPHIEKSTTFVIVDKDVRINNERIKEEA